jgi:hypothetical protein
MTRVLPALLLALPACGYGSYYPQHSDVAGFDTGGVPTVCGVRGPIALLTVSVDAASPPVSLFQVHPESCVDIPLGDIASGAAWQGEVESGTTFNVRDGYGGLVTTFTVPIGAATWNEVIP